MGKLKKVVSFLCFSVFIIAVLIPVIGAKPLFDVHQYEGSPSFISCNPTAISATEYFTPSLIIPSGSSYSYDYFPVTGADTDLSQDSILTAKGYFLLSRPDDTNVDDVTFSFSATSPDVGAGALYIVPNGIVTIYNPTTNKVYTDSFAFFDDDVLFSYSGDWLGANISLRDEFGYSLESAFSQVIEIPTGYELLFIGTVTFIAESYGPISVSIDCGECRQDGNGNIPLMNYQAFNYRVVADTYYYQNGTYNGYYFDTNNDIIVRDHFVIDVPTNLSDEFDMTVIFSILDSFLNTPFFGNITFGMVFLVVFALGTLMIILKFAYGG